MLKTLKRRTDTSKKQRLSRKYDAFEKLINALNKKDLPEDIVKEINGHIDSINNFTDKDATLIRKISGSRLKILRLVEKRLKLVPKGHYQTLWMAVGMSAFGIPLGLVFGLALDNMAFLGIGLPMGMAFGIALGAGMDKKAQQEGRQLDLNG